MSDKITKHLKMMMYEYVNGVSYSGQVIMRPKDRLLRQVKELEDLVENNA